MRAKLVSWVLPAVRIDSEAKANNHPTVEKELDMRGEEKQRKGEEEKKRKRETERAFVLHKETLLWTFLRQFAHSHSSLREPQSSFGEATAGIAGGQLF